MFIAEMLFFSNAIIDYSIHKNIIYTYQII